MLAFDILCSTKSRCVTQKTLISIEKVKDSTEVLTKMFIEFKFNKKGIIIPKRES